VKQLVRNPRRNVPPRPTCTNIYSGGDRNELHTDDSKTLSRAILGVSSMRPAPNKPHFGFVFGFPRNTFPRRPTRNWVRLVKTPFWEQPSYAHVACPPLAQLCRRASPHVKERPAIPNTGRARSQCKATHQHYRHTDIINRLLCQPMISTLDAAFRIVGQPRRLPSYCDHTAPVAVSAVAALAERGPDAVATAL
jgi:hypothetical protein